MCRLNNPTVSIYTLECFCLILSLKSQIVSFANIAQTHLLLFMLALIGLNPSVIDS